MGLIDNFNEDELREIVRTSRTMKEVILKLGYGTTGGANRITVHNRLKIYGISIDHFNPLSPNKIKRSPENIFIENSTATQSTLRRHYKMGQYSPYQCSICGLGPEWQGKELTLILDHINGVNNDHRLDNLRWVCPNCNQQLETTGFKAMRVNRTKLIRKKYYCIDCGKEISSNSLRCIECHKIWLSINRQIQRPERDVLKQEIRTLSFRQLGAKYGISDKAISKWCLAYKLPYRKKDIKQYTDEEWDKI